MKKIIEKLIKNNKTISTMESCTGGYIANQITNIEGCSDAYKFSAVTYSNEHKIKMGVKEEIINKYTVYSKEVADEMSKKICMYAQSDYGIGITGKLNRIDKNNLYGQDNIVYISIYDKNENKFYNAQLTVEQSTREENKKEVYKKVIELLNQII